MGEVLALLSGLFFSSSNLMARQGMKKMDRASGQLVTLLVTNAVNIVGLLILFLFSLIPKLGFWGLFYFGLAGVFTTFAGRFFFFASIERIGATRAGLFKVTAPMFTIFLGILILGDRLTPLDLLGSFVVLSGLYLLSVSGEAGKVLSPPVGIIPFAEVIEKPLTLDRGVIFGVLSGLSLSVGHILRKLGLMHIESPVVGVAAGTLVSLICFCVYLQFKSKDKKIIASLTRQTLCFDKQCGGFMWAGFYNTFAQYLFFAAMLYTTVSVANILISTEALFNLLLVALFFRADEPLTPRLVILSFFILAGVILIIV